MALRHPFTVLKDVSEKAVLYPVRAMSARPDRSSVVVITGVTRGLGRALVDEFVRLGHRVLGCARTTDQIEELRREYPGHDFQTVDVSSDPMVRNWACRIVAEQGAPNFLVNNAAVLNQRANLWEVGDREFSEVIDVNLKGIANVARHFTPAMISRRLGVIVNVTSRWGRYTERKMAPYCATKWAVVAMTRVLAEELKPSGVAVVGLNPGVVKTGMLERYLGEDPLVTTTGYPAPAEWAKYAVPLILSLGLKDTGKIRRVVFGRGRPLDQRL
jgi:NAD(P)-dependent dehydrogenase (short-subunit alcohol dehydrogenase family)